MTLTLVKDDPNLGRPLPLKLLSIERFDGQPRNYFDDNSISALADSIQKEGLQVPIKVTTNPAKKGVFTLIDGERRFRAFKLIHERTGVEPVVDAFVSVVKDLKEHFRLSTIANLHREDLNPLDEAAALSRLKEDGETLEGLSNLVGKSTTYVQGYLKMHELPDEVKKLMCSDLPKTERLSVTSAIDIARSISEKMLQIEIAKEIVVRQLGVNDARLLLGVRTETEGYRFGGRFRKPSDDYKVLTTFLGRLSKDAVRFSKTDVEGLYYHRDDERGDRERDSVVLRNSIRHLQKLLDAIDK